MNARENSVWLVTGASGHLGNTVVRQLLDDGCRVRAFVFEKGRPESLRDLGCETVSGNILSRSSIEPLFAGLEGLDVYVLHLAGLISIFGGHDPAVYKVNVDGTKNMIDAAIAHNVRSFCYCSSVHAIPVPEEDLPIAEIKQFDPERVDGSYAKSKAMASQAVLDAIARGLPAVVVQPVGIIGPLDHLNGHMSRLVARFVDRRLPGMIRGQYNFADVRDIAAGVVAACKCGRIGECYILGGHVVSIKDMMNTVAEFIGRKKIKRTVPFWMAKLAAPIVESASRLMNKQPLFTAYSLYTLQTPCHFTCEKAMHELGYKVRPIRDTLHDMVSFMIGRSVFRRRIVLRHGLANG